MLETIDKEKSTFNSTINKRMDEYVGVQTDRQSTDGIRTKKLLRGYLDNLTYSISKQDFSHYS